MTENNFQKAPVIKEFFQDIFQDNGLHVEETAEEKFQSFATKQSPRATVLMCSDSRVQTKAFNKTATNDLFLVRNIGNQIKTASGSIEYGVRRLHTPILLIIGHIDCGAVNAAFSGFSAESEPIQKELWSLKLSASKTTTQGVIENIHNQVDIALKMFEDLIQNQSLLVVGAVYDFSNVLKQDHGRLILLRLNDEKDPSKLRDHFLLKNIKNLIIGAS